MTDLSPVFVAYVGVFAAAAIACLGSLPRTRGVDDPDTRRGLQALLLTSGVWAIAHVGVLLTPARPLGTVWYELGLVVGLSTIGAWLYFCSAYAGRSFHRDATYRRLALGVFLAIVLVKLTNPLHHLYFQAELVATPFPHLAIDYQPAHWLVVGLSYALALVGYFMLLERLTQVGHETTPVAVLLGVTGLPLVFDLVGFATPYLIDITYEPVGVAVFAVGVLFVYRTQFQAIRVAGDRDGPVVFLDTDGRVREYNDPAGALFPGLTTGNDLAAAAPAVAAALDGDEDVVEVERDGERRHYQVSANAFGSGDAELGRMVVATEVTERERYRQELERQVEHLERFAAIISHDLREPLQTAQAKTRLLRRECDSERLAELAAVHDRMESLTDDVLTLAKQGKAVGETAPVEIANVVDAAWQTVDAPDAELRCLVDGRAVEADEERLRAALENLFQNACTHAGPDVRLTVGLLDDGRGFYVEDDGPGIPSDERQAVFEHGYTTTDTGSGLGLVIVEQVATGHGWDVAVTDGSAGGARFTFTGVEFV